MDDIMQKILCFIHKEKKLNQHENSLQIINNYNLI